MAGRPTQKLAINPGGCVPFDAEHEQSTKSRRPVAEPDVGPAARHVRGNGPHEQGEMRSIRDVGVSLENLEAMVADALQDNPVQHVTRISPLPTLLSNLAPAVDASVGIATGRLMPPQQNAESESEQEADGYGSFIVGTTSAAPITMSIGYAIWLLSEESILAQRLLPVPCPASQDVRTRETKAESR